MFSKYCHFSSLRDLEKVLIMCMQDEATISGEEMFREHFMIKRDHLNRDNQHIQYTETEDVRWVSQQLGTC